MSRWLRDVRLIPIVLIAIGSLFALKVTGLWTEGSYSLGQRLSRGETITVTTVPASAATALRAETPTLEIATARPAGQRSWAQEMFGYPDVTGSVPARSRDTVIVTGSTPAPPKSEPAKPEAKPAEAPKPGEAPKPAAAGPAKPPDKPAGKVIDVNKPDPARATSPAERAILERLLERRQELDTRARELDLRETLLKTAEKNLEAKLAAIKDTERVNGGLRKDEVEAARIKGLVTMYETMKPKDAAKIFDRLDMKVLVEVAGQINPRRMSEIMALMSTEAAEKLTVEFASRSDPEKKPADLPKIDGKP
jgi:flagellar motility protein MotE (MotC chaperone)